MRLYLPHGMLKRPGADISDLTASKQAGEADWAPDATDVWEIPFDSEPTQAEQDAIMRRLTTEPGVEETLHSRVMAAYDQLAAFEAQASPTSAQTVAIVKLLCKVARGLIRLQLRRLDKTD